MEIDGTIGLSICPFQARLLWLWLMRWKVPCSWVRMFAHVQNLLLVELICALKCIYSYWSCMYICTSTFYVPCIECHLHWKFRILSWLEISKLRGLENPPCITLDAERPRPGADLPKLHPFSPRGWVKCEASKHCSNGVISFSVVPGLPGKGNIYEFKNIYDILATVSWYILSLSAMLWVYSHGTLTTCFRKTMNECSMLNEECIREMQWCSTLTSYLFVEPPARGSWDLD